MGKNINLVLFLTIFMLGCAGQDIRDYPTQGWHSNNKYVGWRELKSNDLKISRQGISNQKLLKAKYLDIAKRHAARGMVFNYAESVGMLDTDIERAMERIGEEIYLSGVLDDCAYWLGYDSYSDRDYSGLFYVIEKPDLYNQVQEIIVNNL